MFVPVKHTRGYIGNLVGGAIAGVLELINAYLMEDSDICLSAPAMSVLAVAHDFFVSVVQAVSLSI